MTHPLQPAYDMYVEKLNKLIEEETKIKKMLNEFATEMEMGIPFPDITRGLIETNTTIIRDDDFVGRSPSTAVGEYLEKRGSAAKWDEIVEALKAGGFDWNKYGGVKKARGSIVKNTYTFKYIKQSNAFGLKKWYPEDKKSTPKETNNKNTEIKKEENQENKA